MTKKPELILLDQDIEEDDDDDAALQALAALGMSPEDARRRCLFAHLNAAAILDTCRHRIN